MIQRLELESARLRIRQFGEQDLENCGRFRRQVFGMEEREEAAASWLRWTIDSYRELAGLQQPPYADYALELRETSEFAGAVGIVPTVVPWGALKGNPSDGKLDPEFGLFWGILPAYQRRGFATEAGGLLIDFLFRQLQVRQVVATTEFDNIASQRTMEKLGMRLHRNPLEVPAWCQVVGVIKNPC